MVSRSLQRKLEQYAFTHQKGRRRERGKAGVGVTAKEIWKDISQTFPETKDKNTGFWATMISQQLVLFCHMNCCDLCGYLFRPYFWAVLAYDIFHFEELE